MEEGGGFQPNNSLTPVGSADIDFMDQLFDSGCWLQAAYNLSSQGTHSINLAPLVPQQDTHQQEPKKWELGSSSISRSAHQRAENALIPTRVQNLSRGGSVLNSIWIAPKANPGPSSTVKERLMGAIRNFSSLSRDTSVLIQLWVPVRRGLKNYLTTVEQPHLYDPTSLSLANYRNVSESYQFSVDEDSKEGLGLPGRVFLGKEPEWTPDVQFFRQDEYPRVNHAQICDVRGSIALPVFEKDSGKCLGVVELVTTTQKITYRPEVETVCMALEAVDLRSSEILSTSKEKSGNQPHSVELSELLRILKTVCDKHGLPLGQTWTPCTKASKCSGWSFEKNANCASTVDIACYVPDQRVSDFHEACSEQQLLRGQGVVGKAFETNEPCYAIDVTTYSKSEYPLSHHAKMFGLRGAVAIHLQCLYGECTSYVLEFFLPIGCQDPSFAFHCKIMESLTMVVHGSRSLCFLSTQKVPQEIRRVRDDPPRLEPSQPDRSNHTDTTWVSELVEVQRKGKEVAISFGKEPIQEFKSESQDGPNLVEGLSGLSSASGYPFVTQQKAGEKKRPKTQKDISLQVLRQHFAGSLKEAARSIGVCPTTLKRICRQHGINRWPSRKIKKVGHSLRKLQLVMDSVQGPQGSIHLSSFYSNFPQLNSPTMEKSVDQPKRTTFNSGGATSHSTSSSQTSSSSHSLSNGTKVFSTAPNAYGSGDTSTSHNLAGLLKVAKSEPDLHINKLPQVENLMLLPTDRSLPQEDMTICKVKVTFGEEMIRLSLTSNMSLGDLQCEIAKRFRISVNEMQIKYLDDDTEWVLLACDDDLEECIDIHRTCGRQTTKMAVHLVTTRLGSSLGSRAQS